ncbi:hypothetical protein [Prosthecobacter sp.]|uniref:hypothetical protein n=1 Tax=Prosthecobacter sp. TaxID=1965333 RepID=UPI0037848A12
MKHHDGQSLTIEGLVRPTVQQTSGPELTPLQWIHVIYDHSDDETEREEDLEAAPPGARPTAANATRAAE